MKKGIGLTVAGSVALVLVAVLALMYAAGVGIFAAHVQAVVAKKTLNSKVTVQVFNPSNKIQSQGYFEGLHADFAGFLVKIKIQKELTAASPSDFNKTNLAGIEQECVDAAQTYNAAARSISSQAFRTADLPYQLDSTRCAR